MFFSLRVSPVSLFTREWIEINSIDKVIEKQHAVSLFTREWIEMTGLDAMTMQGFSLPLYEGVDWNWTTRRSMQTCWKSPSLRGSGLKSSGVSKRTNLFFVSLFTREWIEMLKRHSWKPDCHVSLFTREWIEISRNNNRIFSATCLPLYEGVDWNHFCPYWLPASSRSPSLRGSGLKYV